MKRFLSMLAALCIALTLAVPAMAEAPAAMEDELTAVTSIVKETLDIDDDYTEFSGNWNDGLRPGWHLYWSDTGRDLSVNCDPDGVITEMYLWENSGKRESFYGFDATFPAVEEDAARVQAEQWLARLMGEGETARIDGFTVNLTENGEYRFYGRILMDGLESPVTFAIRIGAGGLMGYSRSDSYKGYVGGVPERDAAVKESDAAAALKDAVALELYYVTDADGEARLRYVPVGPYTVVDAQSGTAVDMDALYASFGGSARNNAESPAEEEALMASADSGVGRGLTQVELGSIGNYKDAMSQEALDEALRSLPSLGLEDFSLARCSYGLDGKTGEIRAALRYTAEMDENHLFGFSWAAYDDYMSWGDRPIVTKYVTMDAKTGTLIDLYTSYPLWEEDRGTVIDFAEDPYAAFLQAAAPDMAAEAERCDLTGRSQGAGETFARVHEGYFFPENYLYVYLNPGTGAVDEFRYEWNEDMAFAPAKGIVDEPSAIAAYTGALTVTLGYAAWPEDVDWSDPVAFRYADWGYTFVESLRLAWYYSGAADVAGVDALTGEPVTETAEGGYAYDDLAALSKTLRERIEALGRAGIGFDGGKFRPDETLTQRDAVVLLMQAAGYITRGWDEDGLRSEAVWMGFVPAAADWTPERSVTRVEFLRMILGPSRYGAAAELTGVWSPGFTDVEKADAGYAAVARALGMAAGGTLNPGGTLTRADAAELLYGFMNR